MCLGTLVKTSAKWFCGLVVVSTFLKFPIQVNFAENKKWPTSPIWRAADQNILGGYMRGEQSSPARKGWTKLRREPPYLILIADHCGFPGVQASSDKPPEEEVSDW